MEVGGEGLIIGLAGVQRDIVDSDFEQSLAIALRLLREVLHVGLAHGRRIDLEFLAGLQVTENSRAIEGELDFTRVAELEDNDVMAVAAEEPDGLERFGGIIDEIADEHDEPATLEIPHHRAEAR